MLEVDGDWPVRVVETDSASAPAGAARGHALWPGREHRAPDRLSYRAGTGLYLWAVPLGSRDAPRGDGAVMDEPDTDGAQMMGVIVCILALAGVVCMAGALLWGLVLLWGVMA